MALGDRQLICDNYYNTNGSAVAIVAVVTEGIDWAAYIGGTNANIPKEETVEWVAMKGCKLREEDARHFFPHIKLPYRY